MKKHSGATLWYWCYQTVWGGVKRRLLPRGKRAYRIFRGPGKHISLLVDPTAGGLGILLGVYEPPLMRWLSQLAKLGTEGQVAYDIGSHNGHVALIMAQMVGPTGKVYAFEPEPVRQDEMRANFDLNPTLSKRISIMPYYVGNRHDLARGFCVLDELCFGTGMVELPHIVKIDVEGAEVEVLDGMRMIAAKRFPHTYVECHLGPENENRVRLFFVMYRIPTQRSTPTIIEVSRQGYNTFLYSMSHKASS